MGKFGAESGDGWQVMKEICILRTTFKNSPVDNVWEGFGEQNHAVGHHTRRHITFKNKDTTERHEMIITNRKLASERGSDRIENIFNGVVYYPTQPGL